MMTSKQHHEEPGGWANLQGAVFLGPEVARKLSEIKGTSFKHINLTSLSLPLTGAGVPAKGLGPGDLGEVRAQIRCCSARLPAHP